MFYKQTHLHFSLSGLMPLHTLKISRLPQRRARVFLQMKTEIVIYRIIKVESVNKVLLDFLSSREQISVLKPSSNQIFANIFLFVYGNHSNSSLWMIVA